MKTQTETIMGGDGDEMVKVPAGEFQMGTDPTEIPQLVKLLRRYYPVDVEDLKFDESWFFDEIPRHTVYLDAFYMDKYLVTNAQYHRFVSATGYPEPIGHTDVDGEQMDGFRPWQDSRFNGDNQPVVCVNWHDSCVYAHWAGKRLPTEAEWEKAARGGLVNKRYPWGDRHPDGSQHSFVDKTVDFSGAGKQTDKDYPFTTPVGTYPPNNYGFYDMAGNVWKWCLDEYVKALHTKTPKNNPVAGDDLSLFLGQKWLELPLPRYKNPNRNHVVRGGRYNGNPPHLRCANRNRNVQSRRATNLGFRCAVSLFDR